MDRSGPVGGHHHVARVYIAMAHHGIFEASPARVSFDRLDQAGQGRLVDVVADLGDQRIEVPTTRTMPARLSG